MRDLAELLDRAPALADVDPSGDPDDPEVALGWLLRMARRTLDADPSPVDPTLLVALRDALAERPPRDEALGQLHIEAASCLRRAELVLTDGPVLAVGDDDGVSLALELLGAGEVHGVDLDERLLAFLAPRVEGAHRANVLEEAVPEDLRARFASVVTDPFRDLDGGLGFLCFAAACVREGGDLFWVDHPDWNYEHAEVRDTMRELGWELVETHELVHAYPLGTESFDPTRIVGELGVDPGWLHALIESTSAWSNLYRLRRRSTTAARTSPARGA